MKNHAYTESSSCLSASAIHRMHTPAVQASRRLSGFSLVELMIAIVISSLLLIGVVQVFIGSREAYKLDEGLSRIQESGRFATEFLEREIRMAGNLGCRAKIKNGNVLNYLVGGGGAHIAVDDPISSNIITGFEAVNTTPLQNYTLSASNPANSTAAGNWSPALDTITLVPGGALPGSDIIVVRHLADDAVPLAPPYPDPTVPATQTQVLVPTPHSLQQNQVVMMGDCDHVAIFQIDGVTTAAGISTITHGNAGGASQTPGNICATWGTGACPQSIGFKTGATIGTMRTSVFYVAAGADGTPSLFQNIFDNSSTAIPRELVNGVENMQVVYGVDTDSDRVPGQPYYNADRYFPASAVADWRRVVSVRISVLARTYNTEGSAVETTAETNTYDVAGTIIHPFADRQRRRVFNLSIKLRNR